MKDKVKTIILLLFKVLNLNVQQSIGRLLLYVHSVLRLALSKLRRVTSWASWTSRNTLPRSTCDSTQAGLVLTELPLPVASSSERPDKAVPSPQLISQEHSSNIPASPSCHSASTSHDFHPSQTVFSDVVRNIVSVTSREYERYERNQTWIKTLNESYVIKPSNTDFSRPDPPRNWTAYTHPEGALYFHDKTRGVLTDVYIYENKLHEKLEEKITKIINYTDKHCDIAWPTQDNSIQLVLEIRQSGRYGYYFVDHNHRCLFWLEEYNFIDEINEVKVDYTISHVGIEMASKYWYHNELFPNVHDVPRDALNELSDTIIHAIGDSLTSKTSTSPYEVDSLYKMLNLVKNMQSNDNLGAGSASIIYRLLQTFAHEKFLNLYGENGARLNRNQSIHSEERPRTYLLKILSPILLYGPESHYKQLSEMSIDSLVNESSWTRILEKLTDEWKHFTLYATVLLNANVAFLAIQSIDGAAPPGSRTDIQRASYFSIATSIGTIILGLLLVRQHHVVLKMNLLLNRSVSSLGLETLALMYSLPYALLMWSMLSFLIAFSLLCFESGDLPTTILLDISWLFLGLFLLWCISLSFEDSPYYHPWLFRQQNMWVKKMSYLFKSNRTSREEESSLC